MKSKCRRSRSVRALIVQEAADRDGHAWIQYFRIVQCSRREGSKVYKVDDWNEKKASEEKVVKDLRGCHVEMFLLMNTGSGQSCNREKEIEPSIKGFS